MLEGAEASEKVTPEERKRIEKEIMGLSAKLRWDHVGEGVKDVWRARIDELKEKLRV